MIVAGAWRVVVDVSSGLFALAVVLTLRDLGRRLRRLERRLRELERPRVRVSVHAPPED